MRSIIMIFIAIFGTIGAYLPSFFGDNDIFSPWSVLGGFVGGIFGIWLAVKVSKQWS